MGGRQIAVERQCSLQLGDALRGPVDVHLSNAQTEVPQRILRRERQRFDRERFGRGQASDAAVGGMDGAKAPFTSPAPMSASTLLGSRARARSKRSCALDR